MLADAAGALDRLEGMGQMLLGSFPGTLVKNHCNAGGNAINHSSLPANGKCAKSVPWSWMCIVSVSGILRSLNKSCHLGLFIGRHTPC